MSDILRAQCDAAIALLELKKEYVAKSIGVSPVDLSKALSGDRKSTDIIEKLKVELESRGIIFLPSGGIDITRNHVSIIEGKNCYVELLRRVKNTEGLKELLIMFASDEVSPPEINNLYRDIRKQGVQMRQIIKENDTYIMGDLSEYKYIYEKYFTNIVTLVYGGAVAQVNGDQTRIVIYHDERFAERERKVFNFFWDYGETPKKSTADERF